MTQYALKLNLSEYEFGVLRIVLQGSIGRTERDFPGKESLPYPTAVRSILSQVDAAKRASKYPTCGHRGCTGHVGKFSSCLDEVVWQFSMDSADEVFGDTDWHGYLAMVEVDDHESWEAKPESSDIPLRPDPGIYAVWTRPDGGVSVTRYDTAQGYEDEWGLMRVAYYEWSAEPEIDDTAVGDDVVEYLRGESK